MSTEETAPDQQFLGLPLRRAALLAAAALVAPWLLPSPALAHGTSAGDLFIDHPYAPPTLAGTTTGAVYFRTLVNRGPQSDRLIGARIPVAAAVEFHRSRNDDGLMRMRAIEAIDLPTRAALKLRHGGDTHLMLLGLKEPLRDGDRFPLWLRFERGGEHQVTVWVRKLREGREHRH